MVLKNMVLQNEISLDNINLYQPYEVEQILLYDNANCLALKTYFRMCNCYYSVIQCANAEYMSPSGKGPLIKCGAFVLSEYENIVSFLQNQGISLSASLDDTQKCDLLAYMSLVSNVLEMAELYICWCDKDTFDEVCKIRYGSVYPWPLNCIETFWKQYKVNKRLKVFNWYQKSLEDVLLEVRKCCSSLEERLDDTVYFFGDKPTELDALVFGHIYAILTTDLPNNYLAEVVKDYKRLTKFVQRIDTEFFKKQLVV